MEWYNLFRPHILDRGAEYHQDGCVIDFKLTETGIEAEVEGTENYHVNIELEDEIVVDMNCDCPYAEDGNNCKHMAATLFAYEEKLYDKDIEKFEDGEEISKYSWQRDYEVKKQNLVDLINSIPVKELQDIVLSCALNNDSLRNQLQLKYSEKLDASQMLSLKNEISDIVKNNSNGGYVDWYHASDFTSELSHFLEVKVKLLIKQNHLEQAFELTNLVFHCVGTIDIDDSDGGSAYVANDCYECWKLILENADERLKIKMQKWFQTHRDGYVLDFMEEYVEEFLYSEFLSEEIIREKIKELDEILLHYSNSNACPQMYSVHYGYENVVEKRIEYMRKLGCTEKEIQDFLKNNRHFSVVREMEICEALEAGDNKKAISLLEASKAFDLAYPRQIEKYSKQLIDLYFETSDKEKYIRELSYQLIHCRQNDLTYYFKLKKEIVQKEEWENIVENIISSNNDIGFICKILNEEQRYAELLGKIKENDNVYLMDLYEKQLRTKLPDEVIAFYKKYVLETAARVSDRSAYRHLMEYLKKIKKCPKGKEIAEEIAQCWRVEYKRRTAMMDELRKIGL